MIKIHNEFIGGNIRVKEEYGNHFVLENELRDTEGHWFYWAFCVEGAEGREITFQIEGGLVGYWGPAVSHDLKTWHWLDACDGNSFTYQFSENETKVYFAHNLLYHPDRFYSFCEKLGLNAGELCKSKKGRSVPCLRIGEGERRILLTARHHACESTGNYVLEGVLSELVTHPIPNTEMFCVPFVDFDGVVDGDQGKNRIPHDHNRDYTASPIYPEVAEIVKYADRYGCHLGFDFHAPSHKGGVNDHIFIVRNREDKQERFDRFADALQKELLAAAIFYAKENDHPPMTGWNQPSANFGYTMNCREECDLAFTLETAYFGTENNKISTDMLVRLGRCFAKAIKSYIEVTKENDVIKRESSKE